VVGAIAGVKRKQRDHARPALPPPAARGGASAPLIAIPLCQAEAIAIAAEPYAEEDSSEDSWAGMAPPLESYVSPVVYATAVVHATLAPDAVSVR
jgi:hypothetical protein